MHRQETQTWDHLQGKWSFDFICLISNFISFSSPSFCLTTLVYTAPSSPVAATTDYENNDDNTTKAAAEDENDAANAA